MKAVLKKLYSPDIFDLESYEPENKNNFSFLLQLLIGPTDSEGEESFDVEVCTPLWMHNRLRNTDIIFGYHFLIVKEYNFLMIKSHIQKFIDKCEGNNWDDLAQQLSYIGLWEFDSYMP